MDFLGARERLGQKVLGGVVLGVGGYLAVADIVVNGDFIAGGEGEFHRDF